MHRMITLLKQICDSRDIHNCGRPGIKIQDKKNISDNSELLSSTVLLESETCSTRI